MTATPARADHCAIDRFEMRQAEIVRAALTVIARDGLSGASVRAIAAEMNCTSGVLSHHFRHKNDLTTLACSEVSRAIGRRLIAASRTGDAHRCLVDVSHAFLPTDDESNEAWVLWLHFLSAALNRPELMGRHSSACADARRLIARLLEELQSDGVLCADVDIDLETTYFCAVLDGMGVNSFISPDIYTTSAFSEIVEIHLARLIGAHPPTN